MSLDLRDPALAASDICAALALTPHPEGGHYRELWRDHAPAGQRGAATSILFLLAGDERSHWHRVDAAEIWLWQAGAPLRLGTAGPDGLRHEVTLGPDLAAGQRLQATVPVSVWQEAHSLGRWSLVSCVVAPAFEFAGFEMAPPGWTPPAVF
jgi:predicted cupin superfamily sugar epimerase